MAVSDYKTNPDLNTTISGINIAEGCPPSGINNAIRQLMADVKADSDEQDTAISNAQTTADEAKTTADGKVSKSGDTMTGELIVPLLNIDSDTNSKQRIKDTRVVLGTAPAQEIDYQLWFTDKNNAGVGLLQQILYPDGRSNIMLLTRSKEAHAWGSLWVVQDPGGTITAGTSGSKFQFGNGAQIWVE